MNKKLIIVIVAAALLGLGFWFFSLEKDQQGDSFSADTSEGPEIDYASDVVGTRVGTTTTGVVFPGAHTTASTSYKIRAGGASEAVFTMLATAASNTPASGYENGVYLSLLGSNDWDCATASTTGGSLNPVIDTDINWYDIGAHVRNFAGTQSFTGTSTLMWNPQAGQGIGFSLEGLNYQCLNLQVSASSTALLIQTRFK